MGRPAINLPRVQVRMTEEMRKMLQHRAVDGYRSLNAEIISLIERGLAAERQTTSPEAFSRTVYGAMKREEALRG